MKTLLRVPSLGGARKPFFFLMVSEQVNLNHERHSYGKIKKKILNHCTLLYKQHMDNVCTRIAIHRLTIDSLIVGQSSSSPPQLSLLWLVDIESILHCGSRMLSQSSSLTNALHPDFLSLSPPLLRTCRFQFLGLSRRSLQGWTHPIGA